MRFDCQARAKLPSPEKTGPAWSGIFPVNYRTKRALANCPCAFRLRRLARNAGPCTCSHNNGSFEMSMCVSTAQARTEGIAEYESGIFPLNYCANWLLCNVPVSAPMCSHVCASMCSDVLLSYACSIVLSYICALIS